MGGALAGAQSEFEMQPMLGWDKLVPLLREEKCSVHVYHVRCSHFVVFI